MSSAVKEEDEKYDPVKKDICAICMEPLSDYTNGIALNIHISLHSYCDQREEVGHFFHSTCIKGWFDPSIYTKSRKYRECPTCKCEMEYNNFTVFIERIEGLEGDNKNKSGNSGKKLHTTGVDTNTKVRGGYTILDVAYMSGNKEIFQALFKQDQKDHGTTSESMTSKIKMHSSPGQMMSLPVDLYFDSRRGNLARVKSLLEANVPVDGWRSHRGATPLYAASELGHSEVARELLAKGAEVDAADEEGLTPLYAASKLGHLAFVRVLLAKGAKVDAADKEGATPLFIASQKGHLGVARELLAQGAAVDAARNDGRTPLIIASGEGHFEVVRELLARGAALDAADSGGRTPLFIASGRGHLGVVQELLSKIEELLSKIVIPEGEEAKNEEAKNEEAKNIKKSIKKMLKDSIRISAANGRETITPLLFDYLNKHFPPTGCVGRMCSVQGGTRRRRKVIRKSRERKSRKSMR